MIRKIFKNNKSNCLTKVNQLWAKTCRDIELLFRVNNHLQMMKI